MKTLYIVDASGYLFKSYFALSHMTDSHGNSTNAIFGFIRSMKKIFSDFSPDHFIAVFDGKDNKRKRREIYPKYKAHREEIAPDLPYQIEWTKEYCNLAGIPMLDIEGVEADDTIGSIAQWAEKQGAEVYICSSDKDLMQLITKKIKIIHTHKENKVIDASAVEESYGITPEQFIDFLAITGDASDNVPGLHGFGPKTATTLLQKFSSLEEILAHPEKVSGKKKQETLVTEREMAVLSKQLVTIDTAVPFPKKASFFAYSPPKDKSELQEFFRSHDLFSFVQEEKDPKSAVPVTYTLVDDRKSFDSLILTLKKATEIAFDTETTSTNPLRAELVGIGFCTEVGKAWYVPTNGTLGKTYVFEQLHALFSNPALKWFGHNIKYDIQVLANYDIIVKTICFDTILASYILNAHNRQHSLDVLSLHYFGHSKIPIEQLIGKGKKQKSMADVPIEDVCPYCCEDADYTFRLKQIVEKSLAERTLTNLLTDIELPLLPILAAMERTGIYVNSDTLKQISSDFTARISTIEREIFDLSGEEFNINSPKQLGTILFEKMAIPPPKKTATGFSTSADVLETLQASYPIAEKVLAYRSLEKLRSTYVDALPSEVHHDTNRIHCTFNQSVTATGRLSCQNPNLQNIPVRTEDGRKIRRAFQTEQNDWYFLSCDYSQVELRLLAHYSEDPHLLKAFQNNEDIHSYTASQMLGIPLKNVTKEQRHHAKAVNFGIVYGQQAFGLAKEINTSVAKAAEFIKTYFDRYTRVRSFIEDCKDYTRKTGKARTLLGRERLIPEIDSKNPTIRNAAERLAINTPLQGSAADIIKCAMIDIAHKLNDSSLQSKMILQIHDELLFEFPNSEKTQLVTLATHAMEHAYTLSVPLLVDIAIGKNWEECYN